MKHLYTKHFRVGLAAFLAPCICLLAAGGAQAQAAGGTKPEATKPSGAQRATAAAAGAASEDAMDVATRLVKSITETKAVKLRLSLKECIAIGLENNFDLLIGRLSPLSATEDIVTARSEYDPSIVGGTDSSNSLLSVSDTFSRSTTYGADNSHSDVYGFGLNVQKPLYTGGTAMLGYDFSRTDAGTNSEGTTMNPYWESEVFLALSHPLLRGAGLEYNLSAIRTAQNTKQSTDEEFRSEAISVVYSVEEAYWNLVRGIEDLRVSLKSLQVAMDNRQSSKLQVEAGTRPELDLTTADAGVAERLSAVIQSEATVRGGEDALKNLVNLPRSWYLTDLHIVPGDRPDEAAVASEAYPDLGRAVATALRCRPEINQAEIGTRNAEIALHQRKNERLPTVNVSGALGFTGLDRSHSGSTADMSHLRFFRRSLALTLDYPIGNRSAKAAHRQAKLGLRAANLEKQQTRQSIIVAVRTALRLIRTNRQRVLTTRTARDLHHHRLQAEQRKKEVGLATSLDVLEVEEDFVQAERNYLNALIDYQISLSNLDKECGTLLDVRGVTIQTLLEDRTPPRTPTVRDSQRSN